MVQTPADCAVLQPQSPIPGTPAPSCHATKLILKLAYDVHGAGAIIQNLCVLKLF